MDKRDEIIELIHKLAEMPEKKHAAINEQNYEDAANLRDEEKSLLNKLDEVSGVENLYSKIYTSEKILQHLEILVNNTEQLKKLRPNFNEVYADPDMFDKALIKLYKQRDEAYLAVCQIRDIVKINPK